MSARRRVCPRPAFRAGKRNPAAAQSFLAEIERRANAAPASGPECDWCEGRGYMVEVEGVPQTVDLRCADCNGTGRLQEVEG